MAEHNKRTDKGEKERADTQRKNSESDRTHVQRPMEKTAKTSKSNKVGR